MTDAVIFDHPSIHTFRIFYTLSWKIENFNLNIHPDTKLGTIVSSRKNNNQ